VSVLEMDWEALGPEHCGPVQAVVCNPPYRELGSGRTNPDREQAEARHEFRGSAASAARAAARIIAPGGSLCLIYPAPRLADLFASLRQAAFEPRRLRCVHSRRDEPARLVLVEARAGGGPELETAAPLFIYKDVQEYTAEVKAILSGDVREAD
jgi:tRNA1Val (adenine37-N6)-methyltransferase